MIRVVYRRYYGKRRRPRFWRVVQESPARFYDEYSNNGKDWRRPEKLRSSNPPMDT